ncbi:hypothetical protein CL633_04215 [bacterium]|nr:hypothetical protein [bacterium]|tara:strand:+ start:323 stop:529 length:207 start_codon:yes stop_codon:yes gene_type:complete
MDREYNKYVNIKDKLLREIDEIRLRLSRKLRRMKPEDQLVYFGYGGSRAGIMRDKGKKEYKVNKIKKN